MRGGGGSGSGHSPIGHSPIGHSPTGYFVDPSPYYYEKQAEENILTEKKKKQDKNNNLKKLIWAADAVSIAGIGAGLVYTINEIRRLEKEAKEARRDLEIEQSLHRETKSDNSLASRRLNWYLSRAERRATYAETELQRMRQREFELRAAEARRIQTAPETGHPPPH